MNAVLALEGISARRGTNRVVDGVTFSIEEGEIVSLLGPSGSGKSTVLKLLLGLLIPEGGIVRIRGELASDAGRLRLPPEARDLAVVFQDLALWPHLSVAGNLRFVLRSKGVPRAEERDRIHGTLDRVGLRGFEQRYPGHLSGGEQQRLAIARALVLEPAAVLLDEPLAGLDIVTKREILDLLRRLFSKHQTAVLHVTHDPEEAAALGAKMIVLEGGRMTFAGPIADATESDSIFVRAIGGRVASLATAHSGKSTLASR